MTGMKGMISLLAGKGDKKTHGLYLSLIVIATMFLWIAGIMLDGREFNIGSIFISSFGKPSSNIGGYLYFNIGWVIIGFGLIPQVLYVLRHVGSQKWLVNKIAAIILTVGFSLWGMIGFVHDDLQPAHDIIAYTAFALLIIGMFFIAGIVIAQMSGTKKTEKKPWPGIGEYLLLFGHMYVIMVLFSAFTLGPTYTFSGLAPYEWIGILSMKFSLLGLFFIIPGETTKS